MPPRRQRAAGGSYRKEREERERETDRRDIIWRTSSEEEGDDADGDAEMDPQLLTMLSRQSPATRNVLAVSFDILGFLVFIPSPGVGLVS